MKVIHEIDGLIDFEPWSGAVSTYETLTDEQLKQLDSILEECYPEGVTDTEVNDILWFETDWIAELPGFRNWEHLERANSGGYEPIKIQCYDIEWDTDDEEVDDLPERVLLTIEDEDEIEDYYDNPDDCIADILSDKYGWCIKNFDYDLVEETED